MDLKKRRLEIDLRITCKTFVLPKPNPWVVFTWVVSKIEDITHVSPLRSLPARHSRPYCKGRPSKVTRSSDSYRARYIMAATETLSI